MSPRHLVLAVACALAPAHAQTVRDGQLISERRYVLPAFDKLTPEQRSALRLTTHREYESVRADRAFLLRKVQYGSEGLRVIAYVAHTTPPSPRMPIVIFNRGSYVAGDLAPSLAQTMHRFAKAGFLIVAPQYRGSDGGEGRDDMGGADVADVLHAITLARALQGADTGQVFMYGESRGGMMAFQALREGARLRAVATVGAFTDLDSLFAEDSSAIAVAGRIWPDFAQTRAAITARRSAARWADRLRAPLLILHGQADPQVSPRQSMRLAQLLDAAGRRYELHVIAGGSHTLSERARERDELVIRWFRSHGAAPPE